MIIFDTNVISELMKGESCAIKDWVLSITDDTIVTCAISVFEIEFGIAKLPNGKKKQSLFESFNDVIANFEVLPFDNFSAKLAAEFLATQSAKGMNNIEPDMMIAGICAQNSAILATRNVRDFEGLPIKVVNPWGNN